MAKPTSLASIALFLGFAYGFAIAVALVVFVNGGDFRSPAAGIAVTMMMFSPSLGAVLATKLVNRDSLRVNGIAKGRLRHYLLAWGYPLVVILIGLVLVSLLKIATVDFNNFARILPSGLDKILAIAFLVSGPFINFIPALGEEYGWRGFLQPALIKRLGVLQGLTLTGIIWGLWHSPLILQGYNYPQHPSLIGVGLFTGWAILLGYFLGWLRIKSNSCFPAALAHGAINAYAGFGIIIAPTQNELLALPLGLPGFLALAVIAAAVLFDLRRRS